MGIICGVDVGVKLFGNYSALFTCISECLGFFALRNMNTRFRIQFILQKISNTKKECARQQDFKFCMNHKPFDFVEI